MRFDSEAPYLAINNGGSISLFEWGAGDGRSEGKALKEISLQHVLHQEAESSGRDDYYDLTIEAWVRRGQSIVQEIRRTAFFETNQRAFPVFLDLA